MNILIPVLFLIIGISLCGIHCLHRWGRRMTFNFFFFAFLVSIIKEGPMMIDGVLMKNPTMPYEFITTAPFSVMNNIMAILGWVFTCYLGWDVAHRIAQRKKIVRDNLFLIVLLSGMVTASIGYCVEATAMGLGWWRWTVPDQRLTDILVGVPLIVFETWAHFPTQYLILPFALIECSRFRNHPAKGMFFFIPFIHSITTALRPDLIRIVTEYIALSAMLLLSFLGPVRFLYPQDVQKTVNKKQAAWIGVIPVVILVSFMVTLAWIDLFLIGRGELLVPLLPLSVLLSCACRKIPLLVILVGVGIGAVIFGEAMIPALIPPVVLGLFAILAKFKKEVSTI